MKNTCEVELNPDDFVSLLKRMGVISDNVNVKFVISKKTGGSQWDPYNYSEVSSIKFTKEIDTNGPSCKIL